MRKQDRIVQERQSRQHDQPEDTNRRESARKEEVKASAATEQIRRPERQGGKLPLPD